MEQSAKTIDHEMGKNSQAVRKKLLNIEKKINKKK